jgi:hypothetical protein
LLKKNKIQFLVAVLAGLFLWTPGTQAAEYEQLQDRSIRDILPADQLSGPHYKIRDTVRCDGFMHHFTVDSDFGTFEVTGNGALRKLLREIQAIAALKKIQDSDAFKQSLSEAAQKPAEFGRDLIDNPEKALTGVGKGVVSIFNSAYTAATTRQQKGEDSKAAALLSLSAYKRDYAFKLGVDVYSSNPILQKELDRVGWAGAAGSLSFSAALMPLGGLGYVVSMPRLGQQINEFLRAQPPAKVRQIAQERLSGMGVSPSLIQLFLDNPNFTPRHTAVIVASLGRLKGTENRQAFIRFSLKASDEPSANFMMNMAETLGGYHEKVSPLLHLTVHDHLILAVAKNGAAVIPFPLDYGIWTERPRLVYNNLISTYKAPNFKGLFEFWVSGKLSPTARKELEKRKVLVAEQVYQRLEFMD